MAEFPPLGRLETERLVIRPFSMADLEAARRLLDVELDSVVPRTFGTLR